MDHRSRSEATQMGWGEDHPAPWRLPRRGFLAFLACGAAVAALPGRGPALGPAEAAAAAGHGAGKAVPPDEALKRLMEGNKRFVAGRPRHPNQGPRRRSEVAQGQHPFAVILGCADSRVPPEVVFDQGLGDLFVIRVAGNIVDDAVLGSIEYAVEHLGARLIMVLGHAKCGAVAAALEVAGKGGSIPGHIASLLKPILPAVEAVKGQAGDPLDNAVRANVERVVGQLRSSEPVLAEMVRGDKVKMVGARYDLKTGEVQITTT